MIGTAPTLPGAFGRWLAKPIPAARLVALRVGVGLLVLLDVIFLYLADFEALYGVHGYTQSGVTDPHFSPGRTIWSLLRVVPQSQWLSLFIVWGVACVGLMLGLFPRLCAAVAWACSVSVLYTNPDMHSGGDRLRSILLFTLMLSPLPTWKQARQGLLACGWPAKVILFQLMVMYFFAGAYKLRHPGWQNGFAMYYVLNNSTWCLAPSVFSIQNAWSLPFCKLVSWGTIIWEMSFPVLVLIPFTRWRIALGLGVFFHVLCIFLLQTSTFPIYSLACYLPFVAWERLAGRASDGGRSGTAIPTRV